MSFDSRLDDSRLGILLGLQDPFSYLALHPAIEFAQSMEVDVNWLPVCAPPLQPPSAPGPEDDRGTRHRRYRAEALVREIHAYARAQGLVIREPHRSGDVEAANLAWLWVREHHPDRLPRFLTQLFRAYWALELDAASKEAVAIRVDAAGSDGEGFRTWARGEGPSVAAALDAELRQRGLLRGPAYVVDGEVFQGRQHLPMIRWLLQGRSGRPPI